MSAADEQSLVHVKNDRSKSSSPVDKHVYSSRGVAEGVCRLQMEFEKTISGNQKPTIEEAMKYLQKELSRTQEREMRLKNELAAAQYSVLSLQAIVRQYRTKFKKVRTVAMAGIARDDMLMEWCSSKMKYGEMGDSVKSDNEDDRDNNKVAYSYIDNEQFNNEI